MPGTAGYVNNNYVIANGSNVQPVDKRSIKGDHVFNEKHRISGYYGYDREAITPGPEGPPTLPGLYTNYNDLQQASDVVRFSWDWAFSPTKLNHFYAGGNNWRQDHKPPQEYIGNWKNKFCLGNVPDCNENLVNLFSGGTGDNYTTWGGQANNGSENTVYAYNDDFTWIHGAHTHQVRRHVADQSLQRLRPAVRSRLRRLQLHGNREAGRQRSHQGGNAFASFLLGYADSGPIDTVRFIGQQFPYFAGFFQDDWRVNRKLVINFGLRWDTNLPPTGLNDRWSDFSPTTPNPAADGIPGAVIFAGTAGPRRSAHAGGFLVRGLRAAHRLGLFLE